MTHPNTDAPEPQRSRGNNRDSIIIFIEGGEDSTIRPLRPETRRLLDEDGNIRVRPNVPERKPPSEAPSPAP